MDVRPYLDAFFAIASIATPFLAAAFGVFCLDRLLKKWELATTRKDGEG